MLRGQYEVDFPNGEEHYACMACAALVIKHDPGAKVVYQPAAPGCTLNYPCCTQKPKGLN